MKGEIENNFIEAYKKYYKLILNYIYFRVSRFDLAEDLTQETFLKIWIYVNENKLIMDYKNFLYRVAKNLIIDSYKKKEKMSEISLEMLDPADLKFIYNFDEKIDNKILYNYISLSINNLDSKYKKILTYRLIKQLSIDEICDKTKMSPNHVSVIIHRGLKILKDSIDKKYI